MAKLTVERFLAMCPGLLFVAEADGALCLLSRALEQRFGHQLGEAPSLADLDGHGDGVAPLLAALSEAEPETEQTCTLYTSEANGAPVTLHCAARRDADGLIHGQLEVGESVKEQLEHGLLATLMRELDIVLWAIDDQGVFLFQDGKALAQAGLEPSQHVDKNLFELYPPEVHGPTREVLAGKSTYSQGEVHGVHWENWMVPLDMSDGSTYCAGISIDVSERIAAQRSLETQIETIKDQQRAIYELSAPVLNVWDKVLAVPLIGSMDSKRTDELRDRLLDEAHRGQTRFVILDLTGVEAVDTSIAAHVLRMLAALGLLGVEGMVTGVSPEVARTMVSVGVDFEDIMTHRSLREGLRHCMHELLSQRE